MDPWIEAEKNCLPSILEDLSWEILGDLETVLAAIDSWQILAVEMHARQLIRRGRQYLALKELLNG